MNTAATGSSGDVHRHFDGDSVVVARGDIMSGAVDDETVLMSAEAGRYYGLDDIGSDIWRRLQTPVRIDDLCTALAADYAADPKVVEVDVLALLEKLHRDNLIDVTP